MVEIGYAYPIIQKWGAEMVSREYWPVEETQIPELLAKSPTARAVLDRYGLRGCGGPLGPSESLRFFARAHGVPLDRLLRELRTPVTTAAAAPTASAAPALVQIG